MTVRNDDILVLEVFYCVKLSANTRWIITYCKSVWTLSITNTFVLPSLSQLPYSFKSKSMRFVSSQGNFSTERCINKKRRHSSNLPSRLSLFLQNQKEKIREGNVNEQDKDVINIVTNQSLTMKETSRKIKYTHIQNTTFLFKDEARPIYYFHEISVRYTGQIIQIFRCLFTSNIAGVCSGRELTSLGVLYTIHSTRCFLDYFLPLQR